MVRSACFQDPTTLKPYLTRFLAGIQVMGALMKAHKGEFDGKAANQWVAQMLTPKPKPKA